MSSGTALQAYLSETKEMNGPMVAYTAALEQIAQVDSGIAGRIVNELKDQRTHLKLIASENFSSIASQLAMGNLLTDKYSEGFAYHRFYAGCDNVDAIEAAACEYACELFGAEHAYVQPHSGADANLVAYWAILNTRIQIPALEEIGIPNPSNLSRQQWDQVREKLGNQRLLGLDYYSGGHLTRVSPEHLSSDV